MTPEISAGFVVIATYIVLATALSCAAVFFTRGDRKLKRVLFYLRSRRANLEWKDFIEDDNSHEIEIKNLTKAMAIVNRLRYR
ncbi:MAG TPA: hypothetical protein VI386_17865 [Candidatus Sulfotelmatobacter sp.]